MGDRTEEPHLEITRFDHLTLKLPLRPKSAQITIQKRLTDVMVDTWKEQTIQPVLFVVLLHTSRAAALY